MDGSSQHLVYALEAINHLDTDSARTHEGVCALLVGLGLHARRLELNPKMVTLRNHDNPIRCAAAANPLHFAAPTAKLFNSLD